MLIKKIIKDPKEVKRIRNYVPKLQTISAFSDIAKFADFRWKNADVSTIQGVCHVIHIFFGSSLGNLAKFHHCMIDDRFYGGGSFCTPAIQEQSWKGSSWIGLILFPTILKKTNFFQLTNLVIPVMTHV